MSPEPNDLGPELKSLEAALAGLAPRSSTVDRDQLLYAAGAAAAQSVTQRRLLAFGLPTVLALLLVPLFVFGGLWMQERQTRIAEHQQHAAEMETVLAKLNMVPTPPVVVAVKTRDEPSLPSDKNSYLRLRKVVLTSGAEALESPPGTASSDSQMESLRARDAWLQGI